MNPRQIRGDQFQERLGLFAPQPIVENGARHRLVDGDDELESMFRQMRLLMRSRLATDAILRRDDLRSGRVETGAAALGERVERLATFSFGRAP